ncbi:predicted protein [Brucella suis bv. 4 str. 40]|uniref:Uncharacterized protein n=1 Tax=Brucella neotomae 5K33 TaxID=520456 RepID=A0A7U8PYA6_BRUNE|nr:hypothetical protein BCA52141_I3162 [Brucella canis HSK A52141]EEW90812.1 predicted protein [Brucella suis bv. 4 str. 40]EEY04821.1 predicted protein [Brucella neotomae 5K33]EEY30247.1 predicted protein [Brucella suis bv. 5 str. 513]EFG38188.1 predicted protein [Brucella sp. NVSL 07-0026]
MAKGAIAHEDYQPDETATRAQVSCFTNLLREAGLVQSDPNGGWSIFEPEV